VADWYPWYPALYESDTMHLTLEQDAIYRRLIDHYMKTRLPLPDSDVALARIAGADLACFEYASSIVRAFFKHKNGKLFHKFCDEQLDIQDKRAKNRSEISKRAAAKRWKENKPDQQDECIEHASNDATQDATGQDKTVQDKESKPPVSPLQGDAHPEVFENENLKPPKSPRRTRGERLEVFMAREFPDNPAACPQAWGEAAVKAATEYRPTTNTDFTKIVNWHFDKFFNHFTSSSKANASKSDWQKAWQNWWKTEFERIAKQEERDEFYAQRRA